MSESKYHSVNFEDFRVGSLSERNLYLFLPSNNRYVLVCSALNPIDEKIMAKMRKSGRVVSDQPSVLDRFKEFHTSVKAVEDLCQNSADQISFEVGKKIIDQTLWLADHVFYPEKTFDPTPVVAFMSSCFKSPHISTLLFISDLSIEMYEKAIVTSCLSGLICLWKGYHSYSFIQRWMDIIFCESISEANAILTFKKEDPVSLLKGGIIPEYKFQVDYYFESILTQRFLKKKSFSDLDDILEFTDFLLEKRLYSESFQVNRTIRTIQEKIKMAQARKEAENKERAKAA